MKELLGKVIGVAIILFASFLLLAFVKWDIDVSHWSAIDRFSIILLPVVFYGFGNVRDWLARRGI